MGQYSRKSLWIALLLLSMAAGGARGQWRMVAPNLTQVTPGSGALCFCDGILWLSTSDQLEMSTDSGLTWTANNLPLFADPFEINFLDRTDGVAAGGNATFVTHDGGSNWQEITTSASTSACFLNNANSVAIADRSSIISVTTNAGSSWQDAPPVEFPFCVRYKAGIVYLFGGQASGAFIFSSTDFGVTWQQANAGIDWDSYSFAIDSCDPNRIYLSHEDVVAPTDRFSKIFLTTNRGNTWQTIVSHPLPFFSGSVAEGNSAIYCQSTAEGVFRSLDRGMTWSSIGGPSVDYDTRLIAAINDNILIAVDSDGNVWRTDNSGGDFIRAPVSLVIPSQPAMLEQSPCSAAADTFLRLSIMGCGSPSGTLDSVWVTGSPSFQIVGSAPRSLATSDSILISCAASHQPDTAELHLRYDLGFGQEDTTIRVISRPSTIPGADSAQIHRESASAYLDQFDSLVLEVDLNSRFNLDSIWPFLTDIQATYSWDSSVVTFQSYQPPSGWNLTSVNARGDAADIAIHNSSSTSTQPLNLGTAIFQPAQGGLATTWVELPRLVLEAGGKAITICASDNEDNHWAVKTLGASNGVAETSGTVAAFSIYPNPSNGNVSLSSNDDLGEVTIEIYDMLGVMHERFSVQMNEDNPVEVILPACSGVYSVLVKTASEIKSLRVVREN